jgi:hypothetical protein
VAVSGRCARAADVLAIRDISVEESDDLPSVLEPLVEDAASAVLGRERGDAGGEGPAARELLLEAVKAAAPALLKLQVRPDPWLDRHTCLLLQDVQAHLALAGQACGAAQAATVKNQHPCASKAI